MKMDLLSILRENGTGLLEGMCRLEQATRDFSGSRLIQLKPSERVKMNFSLGIEHLGNHTIRVDSKDGMVLNCTLVDHEIQGPNVHFIITILDCDYNFGKFLAFSFK